MYFSILFENENQSLYANEAEPACFRDLNLDQIVAPILKSKAEYELSRFFYTQVGETSLLGYRQGVLRELENAELYQSISAFSSEVYSIGKQMKTVRERIAAPESYDNNYVIRGRLLELAERYCNVVSAMREALSQKSLQAKGLREFQSYLTSYCGSEAFLSLQHDAQLVRTMFSGLKYNMQIKSGTIKVRKYEGQTPQTPKVNALFERFQCGTVKDYRRSFPEEPRAEHVEAAVLSLLAKTYPQEFRELDSFCTRYAGFTDETLFRFSREIQFYLSWTDCIRPLREDGLPFCYPDVMEKPDSIFVHDGFDLALSRKIGRRTVSNNYDFCGEERILVITGPNQGGKTTYARAFGQICYLAALGLSVPGREAHLFLPDRILTHFEREENLTTQNGKLKEELVRLKELQGQMTASSLVVVNEIFSSTTLHDALLLGTHMMEYFRFSGAVCLIVTFLDELARFGPDTVSMMSTVLPDDPSQRTFQILRKPPDGLAYAIHIASRHGLTYEQLKRRLERCARS